MSIKAHVARVWAAEALLGEGPTWDARAHALFWVDIKGGLLHAYEPKTAAQRTWRPEHRIFSLDAPPAGWRAPANGNAQWFIGCAANGFGWIGVDGERVLFETLAHPERDKPENRYNDGKTGPDGRYWAGSMHDPETEAAGSLYAFSSDGRVETIDTNYQVTNGPAFSPDGRIVYHTDSARQVIYRFDLGLDGRVSDRQVFRQFGENEGHPDGMTTDAAGNVWVAMWNGACVRKLSPRGDNIGRIPLPATRPTSCVFADEKTLFVTSARVGLPSPGSDDGALFAVSLL